MAVITEEAVRTLARFSADAPVTTCYLDVDGRRLPSHQDVQRELDGVLRRARPGGNGQARPASVADDLARIERYVRGGIDRSGTRGLAMFSCSAAGWWEVHHLPVKVTSQLVVQSTPCIGQLERIVNDYERFGVLLADRQRARCLVFELGELVDHTEAFEPIVRQGADDRGERVKTRHASQLAEQAQQHLRHTAALAFHVFQRIGFDRLLVGAPSEMVHDLESALHPYLQERLDGHVAVAVNATDAQVRAAAHAEAERVERRKEAELVRSLQDLVATRGRAVAGLGATLAALGTGRAERLLVSQGFSAEGWRCACGALTTVGRSCPLCRSEMGHEDDIVEVAVEAALAHQVRVESCVNADLDVLGRIGAFTRY